MNCITPISRLAIHCNKSYYRQTRRLAGAVVWLGLAFSPAAVLAADIIANPNIISTDQSGNNALGVKATTADAENGVVEIQTGGIIDSAVGGVSDSGNAKSNQVTVSGGTVNGDAYGGYSDSGNVKSNQVTVSGGTVDGDATGGYSDSGTINNNQVTVSGGTVQGNASGGASDSGDTNNNQVTVSSGTVEWVIGGETGGSGTANNNQVTVSGGTVAVVLGGGARGNGTTNYNQVTITGGTVKEEIGGGSSHLGDANNNQVTITGGTFTNLNLIAAAVGAGTVKDNTLTISGGSFADSVDLYGYYTGGTPPTTASGNSIHLKVAGLTINNIAGVNNLYFYLPASVQNGDSVAILKDAAAAGTDLSSTVIGVCAAAGSALAVGDEITLIDAAGTLQTSSNNPANNTSGMTGCSTSYTFALEKVNNTLIAKLTKVPAPQQGAAQPVPGLGGKTLALLMLILAAMTAWFIHRRSATVL